MGKTLTYFVSMAFILFINNIGYTQISQEEREALIEFYNATSGSQWKNTLNGNQPWLISEATSDVSNWYGVNVTNNQVTSIILSNNDLKGQLPNSLNNLKALDELVISSNNFTFSDFESEFEQLNNRLTVFEYSPQLSIGVEEIVSAVEGMRIGLKVDQSSNINNNSYQWYKNDVAITGATHQELIFEPSQISDAASYTYKVVNSIIDNLELTSNPITLVVEPCGQEVPESEKQALLEFYIQTNGDQWTNTIENNNAWDFQKSVCTWYGVSVENGRVTSVNLSSNNLNGTLPPSLNRLGNLKTLNLSDNSISATIPSELSGIDSLEYIDLSKNQLEGALPVAFGSLQNIVEIKLGENQLIGEIPPSYCTLLDLKILDLSNNKLAGNVIAEFRNLRSLEVLDLSNNDFSGIVPRVFSSGSTPLLNTINIANNDFEGLLPNGLVTLNTLENLDFSENKFVFKDFQNYHDFFKENLTIYNYDNQQEVDSFEEIEVTVGEKLTITTGLSSEENIYNWTKGGNIITTGPDNFLTIDAVTVSDTGVYSFEATNNQIEDLVLKRKNFVLNVEDTCGVSDQTKAILLSIYNNLNGANWTNTANNDRVWDTNTQVCNWYGITVESGEIVEIDLSDNNLSGVFLNDFRLLSSLRKLNIEHNNFVFSNFNNSAFSEIRNKLENDFLWRNQQAFGEQKTLAIQQNVAFTINTGQVFELASNQYQWYRGDESLSSDNATAIVYNKENTELTDKGIYELKVTNPLFEGMELISKNIRVNVIPEGDTCYITEEEKQALLEFYLSTTLGGGLSWDNVPEQNQWKESNPVCQWIGIGVEDHHVVSMVLNNYGLTGVIPESIEVFKQLKVLRISGNTNLRGGVPEQIKFLTNLETLVLAGNNLEGELPDLSSLVSLEILQLGNNKFRGPMPALKSDNLTHISLVSNNFTEGIPTDYSTLKNLRNLLLSNNANLGGTIPSTFSQFENLSIFSCNNCGLEGSIPENLSLIRTLKELQIANNKLTGNIPSALLSLPKDEGFNFEFNDLSGFSDEDNIEIFEELGEIIISNNRFNFVVLNKLKTQRELLAPSTSVEYNPQKAIGGGFSINQSIGSELQLEVKEFKDENNSYQWYKNGVIISEANSNVLTINNVAELDEGEYTVKVTNSVITDLELQSAPITVNIIEDCKVSAEDRQALIDFYLATDGAHWNNTLSGTQVWDIDNPEAEVCKWYGVTIGENASVVKIELPNNNLRGQLPKTISLLASLESLVLSENHISGEIPNEIGSFFNLQILDLSRNNIVGVFPESIGNLISLKQLNFAYNVISGTLPESIGHLTEIEEFILNNNKMNGELPESFINIDQLRILNLAHNSFSGGIESIYYKKLEQLILEHNSFSRSIPNEISGVTTLEKVHLNHNHFERKIPTISTQSLASFQINNNAFIFSDFEDQYNQYQTVTVFSYLNQALVDSRETIYAKLDETVVLTSEELISANNSYQWYKVNGAATSIISRANQKEFSLKLESDSDFGVYNFIATNSTINNPELVLIRHTITVIKQSVDSDNDGLTDAEETTGIDDPTTPVNPNGTITNPNNSDSDGDGISDGQEISAGTNPNDASDPGTQHVPNNCTQFPYYTLRDIPKLSGAATARWFSFNFEQRTAIVMPEHFSEEQLSFYTTNVDTIDFTDVNVVADFELPLNTRVYPGDEIWGLLDNGTLELVEAISEPDLSDLPVLPFKNLAIELLQNTARGIPESIRSQSNGIQLPELPAYITTDSDASRDYTQYFTTAQSPTVADLKSDTPNTTWHINNTSTALNLNYKLVDGQEYYAAIAGSPCRIPVPVEIGVVDIIAQQSQYFCKSLGMRVSDLVLDNQCEDCTVIWYTSQDGLSTYNPGSLLIDGVTYYGVYSDGIDTSNNRIPIYVNLLDSPKVEVETNHQIVYIHEGEKATISMIPTAGTNLKWYRDSAFTPGSDPDPLEPSDEIDPESTYYVTQQLYGEFGCESSERTEITVEVRIIEPPRFVLCEKFRPNPGEKYVFSGWVRQQGMQAVNPVTRSIVNDPETKQLFLELLNSFVDKLQSYPDEKSSRARERFVAPLVIPSRDRKFDPLRSYVKETPTDLLTVYNFNYLQEDLNDGVRDRFRFYKTAKSRFEYRQTIGFQFSFNDYGNSNVNAYDFRFVTPTYNTRGDRYPIFNRSENRTMVNFRFIDLEIVGGELRAVANFTADDSKFIRTVNLPNTRIDRYYSEPIRNVYNSRDFSQFEPDPFYQQVNYEDAYVKITYEDESQQTLRIGGEIEFKAAGPIIDGWQRIYGEFRVPNDAAYITINLLNTERSAEVNAYFDDIRIHPVDSNLKSFVYDPITQRLQAELDENNYATFYEYDSEGGLIRVKKETERGIYTIQETRSSSSKQ